MRIRTLLLGALSLLAVLCAAASLLLAVRPPTLVEMIGGLMLRGHGRLAPTLALLSALILALVARLGTPPRKRVARGGAAIALLISISTLWAGTRGVRTTDFEFASEGGARRGTLFRPASGASCAVVLMGHGSGWMSRHLYDEVGARFARAGFTLVNIDKPGVGDSEGEHDPINNSGTKVFAQISGDLALAAATAAQDSTLNNIPIGAFGISQAGWVLPFAAAKQPLIRFIALFSGPTATTGEESLFSELTGEDDDHSGKRPPRMPFDEINRRIDSAGPSGFDPLPHLRQLTIPGLWLFGEWDNSIPVQASTRRLDILRSEGHAFAYRVVPYSNHGLMNVRGPGASLLPAIPATVWDQTFDFLRRAAAEERRQRHLPASDACTVK